MEFIDSSKRSLKAVLLHNTNVLAPIPIAHSTVYKEEYENIRKVLDKIKYKDHKWQVYGDLNIITMILGQQLGLTKFSCFLCEQDNRDRKNQYLKKTWPKRKFIKPGVKNVINKSLISPNKVLLPSLHMKLGLMTQFTKAIDKDGEYYRYRNF